MASDDYTRVDVRLRAAQPSIESIDFDRPQMLNDFMGYVRCKVMLKDGRSAVSLFHFRLDLMDAVKPDGSPHPVRYKAKATNPIESAQTWALGRALAYLGWYADGSIASQDEIDAAKEG